MNISDIRFYIPARLASKRLPRKPLEKIGGVSVIRRCWESVAAAGAEAIVVTPDQEIVNECIAHRIKFVVVDDRRVRNGTQRVAIGAQIYADQTGKKLTSDTLIVNVQGDIVELDEQVISKLVNVAEDESRQTFGAAVFSPYHYATEYSELASRDIPKVIINERKQAMYFSRAHVPFMNLASVSVDVAIRRTRLHIGVYGYMWPTLNKIVNHCEPCELSEFENLEQLEWLDDGINIRMFHVDSAPIAINSQFDLESARKRIGCHD